MINYLEFIESKDKKLFIGPDMATLDSIIRHYVKKTKNIASDFDIQTIKSISESALRSSNSNEQKTNISDSQARVLMYSLLVKESYSRASGKLFNLIPIESISYNTASMVYDSINQIRLGKKNSIWNGGDDIGKDDGLITNLKTLIESYERYCDSRKYIDYPMLLKIASEILDNEKPLGFSGGYKIGILNATKRKLTYLENEVITKFATVTNSATEIIDISSKEMPKAHKITAYGFANEIIYVAEAIKRNKININDVAIYVSDDKYRNLIKAYFDNYGIPYYFTSGDKLLCAPLSRLFRSMLEFAADNCSIESLYEIIKNSLVRSEYKIFGNLKNLKADSKNIAHIAHDKQFSGEQTKFLLDLLECGIDINRISEFIRSYTTSNGAETDSFIKQIGDLIELLPPELTLNKKTDFIFSMLENGNEIIQNKEPRIPISNINSAVFSDKKHIFLVGLSASQLSVKEIESPLIPDNELIKLLDQSFYIALAKKKTDVRNEDLREFLSSIDGGEIYYIRSQYDSVEFKPLAPSVLYLEAKGEEDEKIENHYTDNKIIVEGEPNEYDFWIDKELIVPSIEKDEFTPSSIEEIMECPLRYIYKHSGKYYEIDCDTYDGRWLKGGENGTLVHDILEKYFKRRPKQFDENLFNEIAFESREKLIENSPFSDLATQIKELDKAQRLAEIYLKDYFDKPSEYKVLDCERWLKFDYEFDLSDGSKKTIHIKGKADRIDGIVDNGELRLKFIDYKTTKKKNFESSYKENKKSQLVLYPLAARQYVIQNKNHVQSAVGPFNFDNPDNIIFEYQLIQTNGRIEKISSNSDFTREDFKKNIDRCLSGLYEFSKRPSKIKYEELFGKIEIEEDGKKGVCRYCKFASICKFKTEYGSNAVYRGLEVMDDNWRENGND